jgi:hypothetical protein
VISELEGGLGVSAPYIMRVLAISVARFPHHNDQSVDDGL